MNTKKLVLLSTIAAGLASPMLAQSQELARVISTTPITEQVAQPREVCTDQQVVEQPRKSGVGAVLGAVAGGVVGNAFGAGSGRALATAAGAVGGGVLGNRVEGAPAAEVKTVRTCNMVSVYENRPIAYDVTYEYAGRQYTMRTPTDPGQYVRVNVTPTS
jgi:uncharacterized protein YcfJ